MRATTLMAMRQGNRIAFDFDKLEVDFKNEFNDEEIWPTDKIFDCLYWKEHHDKYMRDSERVNPGGEQSYTFPFQRDFMAIIITKADDEDTMIKNISKIPHVNDFHKIVIH